MLSMTNYVTSARVSYLRRFKNGLNPPTQQKRYNIDHEVFQET
ncbi:MAG TPA: hypothetical protein VLD65_07635 [Anaerolineales bacterium]|nr:hypothetical protein [Anaerolineales bacterium]